MTVNATAGVGVALSWQGSSAIDRVAASVPLQEKVLQPDPGQVGRVVTSLADDGEAGLGEYLAEPRELDWRGTSVLDLEELTRREHEIQLVFLALPEVEFFRDLRP